VARDPKQIQAEIDQARNALASTLDEIAYRTSPKKIAGDARSAATTWLASTPGRITLGALGAVTALLVVRKIRNR